MIKKRIKVLGVIPARYASTRLPGKPLLKIGSKSMVMHVFDRAKASFLDEVVVATDNNEILKHVIENGGKCVLTNQHHQTGTSRCAEAFLQLNEPFDAVINIQGDEPFLNPEIINELIHVLKQPQVNIVTAYQKIVNDDELLDNNVVKVTINKQGRALYFSRQVIPFLRDVSSSNWVKHHTFFKHIGIYGYKTQTLLQIVKLPESNLEQAEKLEQLRWLYAGFDIYTMETTHNSMGIDTPNDLKKAQLIYQDFELKRGK